MYYGFYYCNNECFKHKVVKYRFFKSRTFENLPIFDVDKTDKIAPIPMRFQMLLVKTSV